MIREIRGFLLFAKYDSLNTPSLPLGGLGWVFPFGRVGVGIISSLPISCPTSAVPRADGP